jgi:hypothetical protein
MGAMLSCQCRLMPIAALIAPPTLTVLQNAGTSTSINHLAVPAINWTARFDEVIGRGNFFGGSQPAVQRVANQVALGNQELQFYAPESHVNASYQLTFYGPTLQCPYANQTWYDNAQTAANSPQFGPWYAGLTPWNGSLLKNLTEFNYEWRGVFEVPFGNDDLATTDEYSTTAASLILATWNDTGDTTGFTTLAVYECGLYNASYTVEFKFINGLSSYSIQDKYTINPVNYSQIDTSLNGDPARSYMSLMDALGIILVGSVQTYEQSIDVMHTTILDTPLVRAKDFPQDLEFYKLGEGAAINKTLGTLVEELMTNLTMSYFSLPDYL